MLHPIVTVIWLKYLIDWTVGYKSMEDNPNSLIPLAIWRFSKNETNYEDVLKYINDILESDNFLCCEWFLSRDRLNNCKYTIQPKYLYSLRQVRSEIDNDGVSSITIQALGVSLKDLYADVQKNSL